MESTVNEGEENEGGEETSKRRPTREEDLYIYMETITILQWGQAGGTH